MISVQTLWIDLSLLFLFVLDGSLSIWAYAFPNHFHRVAFGSEARTSDPYFRRTALVWASFAVLQGAAFSYWSRFPVLLLVVAGVRLTESYADMAFLLFGPRMTTLGYFGFGFSPFFTLFFAIFFWNSFEVIT